MDIQATRSLSDRIAQNVFALVDLQLYLDTHPADTGALEQYIDISEQLRLLKSQYIREHAPLYNFGGCRQLQMALERIAMALGNQGEGIRMWIYEKRLLHPVSIIRPNLRMARLLLEPYAGSSSALGAALTYLNQRYALLPGMVRALLTDIGTEQLAHCEMLGSMITQCFAGAGTDEIKKAGLDNWFVSHRRGPVLTDSAGSPWTAAFAVSSGDAEADLMHDMAVEERMRAVYEGLIALCDDESIKEPLEFLRQREIVHRRRFGEALDILRSETG